MHPELELAPFVSVFTNLFFSLSTRFKNKGRLIRKALQNSFSVSFCATWLKLCLSRLIDAARPRDRLTASDRSMMPMSSTSSVVPKMCRPDNSRKFSSDASMSLAMCTSGSAK